MPDELQIRGVVGQIKWAYYVAAALHGYTVTIQKATGVGTLRGTLVTQDAFRLAQRPLEFVAPHRGGAWRWRIDTLQIDPLGTVRATLSRFPEVPDESTDAAARHGEA